MPPSNAKGETKRANWNELKSLAPKKEFQKSQCNEICCSKHYSCTDHVEYREGEVYTPMVVITALRQGVVNLSEDSQLVQYVYSFV